MSAIGMTSASNLGGVRAGAPGSGSGFEHRSRGRALRNQLARVVMWAAFAIAMVPLAWILWSVVSKGGAMLLESQWWTNSQRGITNRVVGGGAVHAIQGTVIQGLVTALIAVPIGVMTAIYLVEFGRGRLARAGQLHGRHPHRPSPRSSRRCSSTPSGSRRSGSSVWASRCAWPLVLLMIPVVVRSTEEMLKLVPNELREASYALGVPKWKTVVRIVLPTAFSGIITGVLLGLARVMGETAPLLILGPYTKNIATNLFGGLMPTLPTMINQDRTEVLQPALDRVWGAAATLIMLILLLNVAGRLIAYLGRPKG